MGETEKTTAAAPEEAAAPEMGKGKHGHHGHHPVHGDHEGHGPHGPHGHKHGHGKCSMKAFPADSLMGLMYAFGHRIHHTKKPDLTEETLFGALTDQEKSQLQGLLAKAKDGWKKPEEKPAQPQTPEETA